MESWSYVAEGKGFSSTAEMPSPSDSLARGKDVLLDWDSRAFANNLPISGQQATLENSSFQELGFPAMIGKQIPTNSTGDVHCNKDCEGRTLNAFMSVSALSGEEESTSKLSSSAVDSTSRDSSLIDLKLGRFPEHGEVHGSNFSKGTPVMFSPASSTPPKRARGGGSSSQTVYCQVLGCDRDLSSSKDYHKRHKVCDIHSKTAKVIVNGIEQRFCQQCSRFHLLSEFDDGKRSCRKRLAGHNQRRRKPQGGIHSGRGGTVPQSYNGSRFQGTAMAITSFIFQDILHGGLLHSEKYGANDWCRNVKADAGTDYNSLSAIPVSNGNLQPKSIFPYGFEKQFSPFNLSGSKMVTGSISSDNSSQYTNSLGCPNSSSRSLFHDSSLVSEHYSVLSTPSTIQGIPGISNLGRAPSLLSSHSQNSSTHSPRIPMARPLFISGCSMGSGSEKLIGVSSQASVTGFSNKQLPSPGLSSPERSYPGPVLLSDGGNAVGFEIEDSFQGSEFASPKEHLSCNNGPTIDLLQLSSQLQRVEHQRQSMPVKQENDSFCCLRIT